MKEGNHQRRGSSGEEQEKRAPLRELFRKFAHKASEAVGILLCAFLGPIFHSSDTWQLIINTGTTIITFLMVFLIQNTQNRDAKAIHLKLDELIRSAKGAQNGLIDLEDLSDEEIEAFRKEFQRFTKQSRKKREAS